LLLSASIIVVIPVSVIRLELKLSIRSVLLFSRALAIDCAPASSILFSPIFALTDYIRLALEV